MSSARPPAMRAEVPTDAPADAPAEPPAATVPVPAGWSGYVPGGALRLIELPLDTRTPGACREFARSTLAGVGRSVPRDAVDSVMVVVGELVTDSYLAAATTVQVGIDLRQDDVVVTVHDDRPQEWRGPDRRNDTREMLLDALTVLHESFADEGGTVHVARLLLAVA